MEYTEKEHAGRLIKILEGSDVCHRCPTIGIEFFPYVCPYCRDFIGVDAPVCPCDAVGPAEAVKRTWITLEAKGYLD